MDVRLSTVDFEILRKRISPVLRRITYKLNGHYASFDHEDLFQEALVHLWNDFNAGKLADKTDSYVLQGCYFHLKNFIRTSAGSTHTVSLFRAGTEDESPEGCAIDPEDQRAGSLREDLHVRMLAETIQNNGFSPREKAIMRLCSQDFTVRQIGSRLGVSHVMVVKIMRGIRQKCRQYAEGE